MISDQCTESFHTRCVDPKTGEPLQLRDVTSKPAGFPEPCACACHTALTDVVDADLKAFDEDATDEEIDEEKDLEDDQTTELEHD